MKGKRIILWMLMMAFTLGCTVFPAFSEGEETEFLSIVKVEDDCVWIQTSEGLVPFSKEGQALGEVAYPGADCYAMADNGSIFYSKDGVIASPDENIEWETAFETLDDLLVNESYIVFGSGENLGRVDRSTGEVLSIPTAKVIDIELYDADSIIVINDSPYGYEVESVNCVTLETEQYGSSSMNGFEVAVDAEGIYLCNFGGITRHETIRSAGEVYKPFIQYRLGLMDVKMYGDEIYVLWADELAIYPKVNLNKQDKKVLTVVVNMEDMQSENRLKMAMEVFNAENPEYTVKIVGAPKNEVMKTAIMANEEGYDILYLDATNSAEYKRAGMLYDLSDNALIAENFSHYIDMPFLWETDGSLYGVPVFVTPLTYAGKAAVLEKLGIKISSNWTWDDFFALADAVKESGMYLTDGDFEWEYLRRQYACLYVDPVNGSADYETDTFLNLIEGWKSLHDAQMLQYYGGNNSILLYSGNAWWNGRKEMQDGSVAVGFPMLDGKQVTPVEVSALYVNRYSENAEAAVRFLEIYSSPEVQREYLNGGNGMFLPDYREYTHYESLWMLFGDLLIPTDEEFEQYKNLLSTGYQFYRNQEFEKVERELFRQFIYDELTTDEFIAELQERADLMLGE